MPDQERDTGPARSVRRRLKQPRQLSIESARSARRCLLPLEPGCEVLCVTGGQFSLIDALRVLMEATGPVDVTVATWTAGRVDIGALERFLRRGEIRSLRLVVDSSFDARQPEYRRVLDRHFGDAIATLRTHAKWATLRNDRWKLAIRTSMNLNANRRMETIEVSDDPALCEFLESVTDELFAGRLVITDRKARKGARRASPAVLLTEAVDLTLPAGVDLDL